MIAIIMLALGETELKEEVEKIPRHLELDAKSTTLQA